MLWIYLILISLLLIFFGVWSVKEKKRLRNLHLGDREILSIDRVVYLFNQSGIYEGLWLSLILQELAESTSTAIGLMRPTDKLGEELIPIKGFEGFDRFDWLPKAVYNQLRNDLTADELVNLLWIDHRTLSNSPLQISCHQGA